MQASESRLFSSRSEFHQAVLETLSRSRLSISLADKDFSDWPLETPDAFAQLTRILRTPGSGLRLIVHSPEWLIGSGARFGLLRRTFAGRIECRQAPVSVAPGEGLLIGDRLHVLRRASFHAFRGRAVFATPEQVDPWRAKFEALWQESTVCLASTTLGL